MPIRRIENQLNSQGVLGNLPRFGKLRKGGEKTERASGRDLDHFRLTLEPEYEDRIRPAFESLYGTEPTEFHGVLLAADSGAQAFDYWYESWAHAKLLRRCDGEETAVQWSEGEMRYDNTPRACVCDPLNRDCKQTGRLDIVIPALCEATGLWGKLTLLTTSLYDVIALAGYMKVADAFMLKLPNVAFWSVPFTVGRAQRSVPVTINGKRSIKPMHLLYAQIDPEFNKSVLTPLLTQPAQLLLAGGELPEIEMEQAASWDRDYVMQQTIHLFDHENHWDNTINPMIAAGELTEDMDDVHAIEAILQNREKRKAEKTSGNGSKSRKKGSNSSAANAQAQSSAAPAEWLQNAQRLNNFIAKAHSDLKLNTGNVLEALKNASDPAELENIQDFLGSDLQAWAACIAYKVMYDPERLVEFAPMGSTVWTAAAQIVEGYQQRLADIPF